MQIRTRTPRASRLGVAFLMALALPIAHAQQRDSSPSAGAGSSQDSGTYIASPIRYPAPRSKAKALFYQTLGDAKAYYTAPLHWNARDWEYFGGAVATIAAAHHYDTQVRTHFDQGSSQPFGPKSSGELTDALPGFAAVAATWGYAELIGSHAGKSEAWNMIESAGLSFVSAYAVKYIVRRSRPDSTTSSNQWFSGGTSFPSEHATAAFAIGTVLAESGNPRYRWIRRVLGYGIGAGTAYLRLKHNAHWLSDTVAGAALGMATAHFVMNRSAQRQDGVDSTVSLVPVRGGVMLAYSAEFN